MSISDVRRAAEARRAGNVKPAKDEGAEAPEAPAVDDADEEKKKD